MDEFWRPYVVPPLLMSEFLSRYSKRYKGEYRDRMLSQYKGDLKRDGYVYISHLDSTTGKSVVMVKS